MSTNSTTGKAAVYGYTECHVCGNLVPVRPLTLAQTERAGYDCDYEGEYLGGSCHKCSDTHRSSTTNVVHISDLIRPSAAVV